MPPLLLPFLAQLLLAAAAFSIAPRIAHAPRRVWMAAAALCIAVILCWPLMRLFPVFTIRALSAPVVACIELTGLFIPAVLFFGIAARQVPKRSDGRAILALTAVAAIYFLKAGWWMVAPALGGGVPNLGPTNMDGNGVCRQTTGYTCVAASMVTMLRAMHIAADEVEMARLAHIQVGGGATDSRALWALQQKLDGSSLHPAYHILDLPGLIAAPKPCLVQLDWGFFTSHMVPILAATEQTVTIGDPLSGKRDLPAAEFARQWKHAAITLEPHDPAPRK